MNANWTQHFNTYNHMLDHIIPTFGHIQVQIDHMLIHLKN
jgi:hypothetical protein